MQSIYLMALAICLIDLIWNRISGYEWNLSALWYLMGVQAFNSMSCINYDLILSIIDRERLFLIFSHVIFRIGVSIGASLRLTFVQTGLYCLQSLFIFSIPPSIF